MYKNVQYVIYDHIIIKLIKYIPPKVSFKEKVKKNKVFNLEYPLIDQLQENLAHIKYEDDNPPKLMAHIVTSNFDGLCAPWQDALVVKLFKKNIGFHVNYKRYAY